MSAPLQTYSTPLAAKKLYAEHLRKELQEFATYVFLDHPNPEEKEPPEEALVRLCKTLGVERKAQQHVQKVDFPSPALLVSQANTLSAKVKEANRFRDLLVFKQTDNTPQPGHVTEVQARPDLVGAFQEHWYDGATAATKKSRSDSGGDYKTYVPWPCIRLAGEVASKGESEEQRLQHAATYVDILMTARADFKGGFGLLAESKELVVLFGEAGEGIRVFRFNWATPQLSEAMLVMVHHLYCPGKWEDPNIRMHYDKTDHSCSYEIDLPIAEGKAGGCTDREGSIEGEPVTQTNSNAGAALNSPTEADEKAGLGNERVRFSKFICRYATAAFGTRTHVFVRSDPVPESPSPNVVKLQLCNKGTRFDEIEILGLIHRSGVVPGVVRLACHETIRDFTPGRNQVRLGLEQEGLPFMAIPNIRMLLKVAYDVLEVTRLLHAKRSVIHRDISRGNVMYLPDGDTYLPPPRRAQQTNPGSNDPESNSPAPSAHQPRAAARDLAELEDAFDREINSTNRGQAKMYRKYCFIKCLLGESEDPRESNMFLIDFNRSEDLETSKLRDSSHKYVRTGTPMFMPTSLEQGKPRNLPAFTDSINTPPIPKPHPLYKEKHPERCKRFEKWEKMCRFPFEGKTHKVFRHELHHEAESVFWLIFYWVMIALPGEGGEKSVRDIPSQTWNSMSEPMGRRSYLMMRESHEASNPPYSEFMDEFIRELAACFTTDPYWFDLDPEYHHEYMQRCILNFLLDQQAEDPTMDLNKSHAVRDRAVVPSSSKPPRALTTVDSLRTQSLTLSPIKATTLPTPSSINSPKPPVHSGSDADSTFQVAKREAPSFSPPPAPKRSRTEHSTGDRCACNGLVYTPVHTAVECTAEEGTAEMASRRAMLFSLPGQPTSSTAHGTDDDDPFKN